MCSRLCLLAALLPAFSARAQQSLDDMAPVPSTSSNPPAATERRPAAANGYLNSRVTWTQIAPSGTLPTEDMPSVAALVEANAQLRVDLSSPLYFVYADLSMVYQGGWVFYGGDDAGGRTRVAEHDVSTLRPYVVPSEVYVSASPRPWLNVLVGKKRVQWGSGFAFNPMDLINPPKDPTDPSSQRVGNWLARLQFPWQTVTFSALFAPQALYSQQGIPYAMLRYPDYPPAEGEDFRDDQSHYLLATRMYALLFDADLNLVYTFSNRYQDGFTDKSRLGVSLSRFFFTDYELHTEALLSWGSARSFPDHDCARDVSSCVPSAAFAASKLDSKRFMPRILVGSRRQFADESLLSLEYYYQGDGYSDRQFADAVRLLIRAAQTSTPADPAATAAGDALPQRFSFEPLRRHYLIARYSKPRLFDDWTAGAVLIVGLRDLSGVVSPSLSWSAAEWLTISLYGQIPLLGVGVGEVEVNDARWSEYSLAPFDFRTLCEVRAFY